MLSCLFSGKAGGGTIKGTKDYKIEMGVNTSGPWTTISNGQLPNNPSKVEIPLNNQIRGRYLRFQCITWYHSLCALHYIGIFNGYGEPRPGK